MLTCPVLTRSPRWAVLSPPPPWPPPLGGSAPSLCEPLLPVPVRGCRVAFLAVQSSDCPRDVFSGQVSCCPDLPCGSEVSEGHLSATLWPRGGAGAPWHLQGSRSRANGGPRPGVRAVELPEVGQHPTRPLETGGGVSKLDPGRPASAGGAGGAGVLRDPGREGVAPVWAPPPAQDRASAGRAQAICLLTADSCQGSHVHVLELGSCLLGVRCQAGLSVLLT